MGTISANKLGGLGLMFGPVFALVFFFLQPGGAIIDPSDPANAQATIGAIVANVGLAKVTSVLIPIGLTAFLYGMFVLQANVRSNGNGDALSRLGALLLLVGVIGWMTGFGINLAIAGSDLPVEQAVPTFGSLYSASVAIGTISGLLAGIGFLAMSLAISTRDDYNKIFALVVVVVSAIEIILTIVGGVNTEQLETMNQLTGICYLVKMAWMITLGLKLIKQD